MTWPPRRRTSLSVGVHPMNDELDFVSRKLRFFEGPEGVTIELAEWVGSWSRT